MEWIGSQHDGHQMEQVDGKTESTERNQAGPAEKPLHGSSASRCTLECDESNARHPADTLGGGQRNAQPVGQFDVIVGIIAVKGAEHEQQRTGRCQHPTDGTHQLPTTSLRIEYRLFRLEVSGGWGHAVHRSTVGGRLTFRTLQNQITNQNAANIGGYVLIEGKVGDVALI